MEQRSALTELVRQRVGERGRGGKMTTRAFAAKAVDPVSGYTPSQGLIGKILRAGDYVVTPALVSAIAAGLDLPRHVVAAAAHMQTIGYEAQELKGAGPATLLRELGDDTTDVSVARGVAERWDREEQDGDERGG